ncbi:hypothetical protein NPX13_g9997 [Xylaria arbuscula]|uniref:Uncharacterized protein n=1 Tax=Xylaria arbuscula TaxID=114810 RepID=A0A9W8N5N7_9PEZI|nr:hypothetical protein NPX13_g9997 [Xylaria arbuscula]
MAGLSPQIVNLVIIFGMMQVSKKIPFDDPTVLNGVRALYVGSNIIIAAIYGYVLLQINKKKDLTTLKYVEPAPMGSSEEGKLVTTTVQAYDAQQAKASFRSQLMGIGMIPSSLSRAPSRPISSRSTYSASPPAAISSVPSRPPPD